MASPYLEHKLIDHGYRTCRASRGDTQTPCALVSEVIRSTRSWQSEDTPWHAIVPLSLQSTQTCSGVQALWVDTWNHFKSERHPAPEGLTSSELPCDISKTPMESLCCAHQSGITLHWLREHGAKSQHQTECDWLGSSRHFRSWSTHWLHLRGGQVSHTRGLTDSWASRAKCRSHHSERRAWGNGHPWALTLLLMLCLQGQVCLLRVIVALLTASFLDNA